MKPGDLVQLFSRIDTSVWCWDEDDNDFYLPNGTSAVIIRHGEDIRAADLAGAIDQVLCDGKVVWVHRAQLEVIDEAG
jgi:hypothetical protein